MVRARARPLGDHRLGCVCTQLRCWQAEKDGIFDHLEARLDGITKANIDNNSDARASQRGCAAQADAAVLELLADAGNAQAVMIELHAVVARNREDLAKGGQNGFLARIAKSQEVEIACPARCVGQPSCKQHGALEDEAVGMWRAAQPIEKPLVHKPGEQHIERLRRLAREVEQACTNGCSDIGRPLRHRR